MDFKTKKIEGKSIPFFKDNKINKKLNTRFFFGPEIINDSRGKSIFLKNLVVWSSLSFIVLLYIIFAIINIFTPPKITILFPEEDNYLTTEKTIKIKGRVNDNNAIITINNQTIAVKNNYFEEEVSLMLGVNFLEISGKKKGGQEKKIIKQIVVK